MAQDNKEAFRLLKADCLRFAEIVGEWSRRKVSEADVCTSDKMQVFRLIHAARSLSYFEAVVSLVKAGLVEPAGASLRVLVEQSFVLHAVDHNPALLQVLTSQAQAEQLKAFNALEKLSAEVQPEWMTDEWFSAIKACVSDPKGGGFNAYFWADHAQMLDSYQTIYRLLNSSAHGAMGGMQAYLDEGGVDRPHRVLFNPYEHHAPDYVVHACSAMIISIACLLPEAVSKSDHQLLQRFPKDLELLQERCNALQLIPDTRASAE